MRGPTRRTVLRGLGTALALPWLDAFARPARAAAPLAAPRRVAFVYLPNGAHMPDWTPASVGSDYALPTLLEPLAPLRSHLLVVSGLAADGARPHGDGPGDHARAAAAYLTGAHPVKTAGADIRVGISADQWIAGRIGRETRFPSLELGCEPSRQSGSCDSGYACAYSSTMVWRTAHTPVAAEIQPRLVFERLFQLGSGAETAEARARRLAERRSVLDFVRDDATALRARLGATDQRKLDEYVDGVREIERRLERLATDGAPAADAGPIPAPGVPRDYREHLRLQYDLLALAFRLDLTRVATFMVGTEGSDRNYGFVGAPGGHHTLSHHGRDPEKVDKIRTIDRFHVEELARFCQALASAKEGEGSLLDATAVVFGSGNSDGDRHNHDDLPVVLLGRLGGAVAGGRHLRTRGETPICNLWLTLGTAMGVPGTGFGDSTGPLAIA